MATGGADVFRGYSAHQLELYIDQGATFIINETGGVCEIARRCDQCFRRYVEHLGDWSNCVRVPLTGNQYVDELLEDKAKIDRYMERWRQVQEDKKEMEAIGNNRPSRLVNFKKLTITNF